MVPLLLLILLILIFGIGGLIKGVFWLLIVAIVLAIVVGVFGSRRLRA